MSYRCPYTEVCRAQALREFATTPELAALFAQRLQCGEHDAVRARRCATLLGLAEQQFPTLGQYVQEQRRGLQLPQGQLAEQVGLGLQELRELELNKLDPQTLSGTIIDRLAASLRAPVDYLKALARLTSQAGMPRQGTVFARTIIVDERRSDHH